MGYDMSIEEKMKRNMSVLTQHYLEWCRGRYTHGRIDILMEFGYEPDLKKLNGFCALKERMNFNTEELEKIVGSDWDHIKNMSEK